MSRGPGLAEHDATIRRMAAEGDSDHDIAVALDRSANTIWTYRNRHCIAGRYSNARVKAQAEEARHSCSCAGAAAPAATGKDRSKRRCLRCRDTFKSEGIHNRLCPGCSATVSTMALA